MLIKREKMAESLVICPVICVNCKLDVVETSIKIWDPIIKGYYNIEFFIAGKN